MSFTFQSDSGRFALHESIYPVEQQVKAITGADTCIIVKDEFPVYGKMSLRNHHQEPDFQDFNILYLKKKFSSRFQHLILHELYHIIRYASKTSERLKRFGTPLDAWEAFFTRLNTFPKTEIERHLVVFFMQNWGSGFISVCPDIWIETEIFNKHPDIRHMQLLSLTSQATELRQSLAMPMPGLPEILLHAHFAPQYVFLRKVGELHKTNFVKPYSNDRHLLAKSKACLEIYNSQPNQSHDDDIETTLKFANFLDVSDLLAVSEMDL